MAIFLEDKTIWLALIASLSMHGLIFVFSGKTFIQEPQFSVQPSAQMVEVSIVSTSSVIARNEVTKQSFKEIAASPSAPRNDTPLKKAVRSIAGVRVKADPNYFQNPAPEYPELAKQMRQEGLVMLSVDVDREGEPVNVVILQSSGFRLLDQVALKAVSHWKFQPGSLGGVPVNSTVTVPIKFRLEG